jgi:hypothetical protein
MTYTVAILTMVRRDRIRCMPCIQVVRTLIVNRCSMAPILSSDPPPGANPLPSNAACGRTGDPPAVLHITSLSGVLASLMRHFRASLASLPLLAQPLASMPLGSWSPDSPIGRQGQALSPGVRSSLSCTCFLWTLFNAGSWHVSLSFTWLRRAQHHLNQQMIQQMQRTEPSII